MITSQEQTTPEVKKKRFFTAHNTTVCKVLTENDSQISEQTVILNENNGKKKVCNLFTYFLVTTSQTRLSQSEYTIGNMAALLLLLSMSIVLFVLRSRYLAGAHLNVDFIWELFKEQHSWLQILDNFLQILEGVPINITVPFSQLATQDGGRGKILTCPRQGKEKLTHFSSFLHTVSVSLSVCPFTAR